MPVERICGDGTRAEAGQDGGGEGYIAGYVSLSRLCFSSSGRGVDGGVVIVGEEGGLG